MNFLKSILAYMMNLSTFLSNRVDTKALELKEKIDNEINIPQLREEFKNKVNEQLDEQFEAVTKLTADINLQKKTMETEENRLRLVADTILKYENEDKSVNVEMDELEKISHDFKLQSMRLEAKSLLGNINFTRKFVGNQQQTLKEMVVNYHKNKLSGNKVLLELKTLEQRNMLIESRQSFELIELGVGDYKISDIIAIVDGKEALFEAQKFADQVLLPEGKKTALDYDIEATEDLQLEDELNSYLTSVKNGEVVRLN